MKAICDTERTRESKRIYKLGLYLNCTCNIGIIHVQRPSKVISVNHHFWYHRMGWYLNGRCIIPILHVQLKYWAVWWIIFCTCCVDEVTE